MEDSRRKRYASMALAAICIGYLAPNYALSSRYESD